MTTKDAPRAGTEARRTADAPRATDAGEALGVGAAPGSGEAPAAGAAQGGGDSGGGPEAGGGGPTGVRPRGVAAVVAGWAGRVRRFAGPAALVALLAVSGVLFYAAQAAQDPAARGNRALTDAAATAQVTGEVSDAISRVFAYAPDDTATTAQAARDLLGGSAATQYQALFTRIRQQVAQQRLTLTTRVVRAGVESLTADTARLLVFLDQTAQRAGAPATTAAAQLTVTAHLQDGHWRITDLTAR